MATRLIEANLAEIAKITGVGEGDDVALFGMHTDDIGVMEAQAALVSQYLGATAHLVTATDNKGTTKGSSDLIASGHRIDVEARAEAEALGVHEEYQHYLSLPDTDYTDEYERAQLGYEVEEKLASIKPRAIFTSGPKGFDGHLGHIEGHKTVVAARDNLGLGAIVWGLVDFEDADLVLPVDREYKAWAVAQSETQFPNQRDPVSRRVQFAADAIAQLHPYERLFEYETYAAF